MSLADRFQSDSVSRAERRQVNVLFCDLVDSTALSHRVDPEDLAAILLRYHQCCGQVIAAFRGHIANYLGDGVMAYFGWPTAHEDDAERTIHAGLALVDAVSALSRTTSETLAVRVGIASGLVVIGGDEVGDGGIAGETPNLAARLQAEAAPNTVVITAATARLAGDTFEYESLGQRTIRGLKGSLEVLRVIGPGASESRFEARRARSAAAFVGRREEMALLMRCWTRAAGGEGQLILVSGEAGIGKSRLIQEFRERSNAATALRYQCSPLHTDAALAPISQQIQRAAGLKRRDSLEAKLDKLRLALDHAGVDSDQQLSFVCHLLELGGRAPRLPDFTPSQLHEQLLETLSAQIRGLCRHGPVLVILEDAQWIDPTSEEFILRVHRDLAALPIGIVVTSRDRFGAPWLARNDATLLRLQPLGDTVSQSLVQTLAKGQMGDAAEAGIVARAEGIPLYLEELTWSVLQSSEARERRNAGADVEGVPTTLKALLTMRLDQLREAKRLAQVGSVLGRRFTLRDVRAIGGWGEDSLSALMEQLAASGLLYERGAGEETALVFKHALVHDAAYASLLNSDKKRLHQLAFEQMERGGVASGGASAAVLAFHAERAELWHKAAHYLSGACVHASRASANREALALFDRALAALENVPIEVAAQPAIDVRLHAFRPLIALGQIDRLVRVVGEAEDLARKSGDKRRQAAAKGQLAGALWMAGQHRVGIRSSEDAVRLATELDDFVLRLSARFAHANFYHALGMIREAAELYTAMLADLQGELEFKRLGWHAIASVLTRGHLAWSQVWLGEFPQAWRTIERAHEVVRQVPDPYSIVYAHMAEGLYHIARADQAAAIAAFEAAHLVNTRAEMVLPIALAWLGAAYAQGGRSDEAVALLLEAERDRAYRAGGNYCWTHHFLALAQAHLARREFAQARASLDRAQAIAEPAEEIVHVAWILKVRGDIESVDVAGASDAALAMYRQAIDIGRPRGLRPLVAQCHAALGRVLVEQGQDERASRHSFEADRIFRDIGLPDWRSRFALYGEPR